MGGGGQGIEFIGHLAALFDDPDHGLFGVPRRAFVFPVADALVLAAGNGDHGAQRRRRLRDVQVQQVFQFVFDALVVGPQGKQNLPQFPPAFFLVADAEPLLRVHVGRNQDGADDVADLLVRRGAHGPPDGLDNVDGAFARLQEGDRAERRRIGAFAEDADIDDPVGRVGGGLRQQAFGVFPGRDVVGGVQVLQRVMGGGLPFPVLAQPVLKPRPHRVGLQVRRHVPGLVHGVHEGDAGCDGKDFAVLALGGAAHGQGESHPPQIVGGCERAASFAPGFGRQQVGLAEGFRVVDAQGDDAIVGEPAVPDGLHVALAVEFHAEDGLVVHGAHDPVAGLLAGHLAGVVDAGRGGLIDSVDRGESVVVVAQGEVAEASFLRGEFAGARLAFAAQSRGAVRFVGDEDAGGDVGLVKGVGDGAAALIGAEDDADLAAAPSAADPCGDVRRVGGDLALYLVGADVAVVQRRVFGGVARAFFSGVVAGGLVGADGQRSDALRGVLQVLAPDLRHQRDGRAQDDRQFAGRRQFLDDAQGNAGFAGAAGQDDLAAGLASGQAAAVRAFMRAEYPHAFGDGLGLHAGLGLPPLFAFGTGLAVRAVFVAGERRRLFLLAVQVGGDVDHLHGLGVHRQGFLDVAARRVVAVGDDPAFRPKVAGRSAGEAVDLRLVDGMAVAVFVELPGLALDGDVFAVAAANRDAVDADVLSRGAGESGVPLRPFGPGPAFGDVPFPDAGRRARGDVFEPLAPRRMSGGFRDRGDGRIDDVLLVGAVHRFQPVAEIGQSRQICKRRPERPRRRGNSCGQPAASFLFKWGIKPPSSTMASK